MHQLKSSSKTQRERPQFSREGNLKRKRKADVVNDMISKNKLNKY